MAKGDIKKTRRDNMIESALKVFAQKGYSDATMADISKEAGVSTPVLYEYFKTKEDLLFAIPDKYTKEPTRIMEFILPYIRGPEAKIRAIVQGHMTLYEQYPLYSYIVMLQLKTNRNFMNTKSYQAIRKVARILLESIREGIDDGTFKEDTDAFLIRSMILGAIEHLCTRKILVGEPKNLSVFVDPMIDVILGGIKTRPKQLTVNLGLQDSDITKIFGIEALSSAEKTPSKKKAGRKTK